MAQSDPIGVVFDFDGTLTPKEYGSLIRVVEDACLPALMKDQVENIRQAYLEKAALGPVAPVVERKLITESLCVYVECGLNHTQWSTALDGVKLRDGVSEKIRELAGRGIKIGIISFGVADFIERVLERYGLGGVVHRIYAAQLIYDRPIGKVVDWNSKSVVHPFDKGVWSTVFARSCGIAPEHLLAVGDSTGDRLLGIEKRLRLGIAKNEEEAKQLAPFMGKTVVTENFAPVSNWIDEQIYLILKG